MPEAFVTLDEAAAFLHVSRRLLREVVGAGPPFPIARDGRKYLIPAKALPGILEGRPASQLVRTALAQVREQREDALELSWPAEHHTVRRAATEALSGTRLARAARSPERRIWERAFRLLLAAVELIERSQLPAPSKQDFLALAGRLKEMADTFVAVANRVQGRGEPAEQWDQAVLQAAPASEVVREYLEAVPEGRASDGYYDVIVSGGISSAEIGSRSYPIAWDADTLNRVASFLEQLALLPVGERAAAYEVAAWLRESADWALSQK